MSSLQRFASVPEALEERIGPVLGRARLRRMGLCLAAALWGAAAVAAGLLVINRAAESALDLFVPHAWIWLAMGTALAMLSAGVFALWTSRSVEEVARQIEADFPDLDSALLTAIEQRPAAQNRLSFLQQDVISQAVAHSQRKEWSRIVPGWQILAGWMGAITGLLGVTVAGLLLVFTDRPAADASIHLFRDVASQPLNYKVQVEPGTTEIERGTRLLVMAHFDRDVPPRAELSYRTADGAEHRLAMTKSLDDPVFAGRITSVTQPLTYSVSFGEESSDEYQVSIFEYPSLLRSDVDLKFPSYTNEPEKKLQDVRRISAVVGTEARFKLFVNKAIAAATLVPEGEDAAAIELVQDTTDPLLWTTDISVVESVKFRVQLRDAAGRKNKAPPRLSITALLNQPPKIKLVEPARDVQVSAIEEISLQATAWDDFGPQRVGFTYSIGGEPATEVVLAESQPAKETLAIDHLLELEELAAEPDQLIAYHFWSEDLGPDGTSRRSASDMYFAEVRPFEEIYRQAQGGDQESPQSQDQQQQQQGNQNAEQAQQLAELQKEIINATWRVIRRESQPHLSEEFPSDLDLLVESQLSAAGQATALVEELQDPGSLALGDELQAAMLGANTALAEARADESVEPLERALRHEQAAYQALLRMRAREFEVQRTQRSQTAQQQSSQSRQQRQMQQLALEDRSDRYEQERFAQEQQQQTQEQRANRQVLSRLRELARRQNDLNQRIKELQSAQEAETKAQQDEIERQLKRLQEEQQKILRDTDELQERMQQPENQERMADQSEQLEQARQNAQQASEALSQGELSRASTEGTRAERELKELRDQFQQRTSGQFTQEMREMRNQARDLEQQQTEVAQRLRDARQTDERPTSLSDDDSQAELLEAMEAGQQQVEELREKMKQMVEEAEEFEPLLAEKLYETYRETEQSRPDQALESARRSWQRGFADDAVSEQRRAAEGIQSLREGVDEAAESVLGDETEALRIARTTLNRLSEELDAEIDRAESGREPGDDPPRASAGTEPRSASRSRDSESPSPDELLEELLNALGDSSESPPGGPPADSRQPGRPGEDNRLADPATEDSAPDPNGQRPAGGRNAPRDDRAWAPIAGDRNAPQDDRAWAPIAGDDFMDWSDRLRDVEEMIADPELRAEAARIRDRAKAIRRDLRRHSEEPNWDLVKLRVAEPLVHLEEQVTRELLRRDDRSALIPLDREPVPVQYERAVQKYYEQLGSGE